MWADGGLTEIAITFCILKVFVNDIHANLKILVNAHDVNINNEINREIKLISIIIISRV